MSDKLNPLFCIMFVKIDHIIISMFLFFGYSGFQKLYNLKD